MKSPITGEVCVWCGGALRVSDWENTCANCEREELLPELDFGPVWAFKREPCKHQSRLESDLSRDLQYRHGKCDADDSAVLQCAKLSYEQAEKLAKQWDIYGPEWQEDERRFNR